MFNFLKSDMKTHSAVCDETKKLRKGQIFPQKRNSANDVVQLAEWDIYAYGPFRFFLNTDICRFLHQAFYDLNTFQEGLKMEIDD